MMTRQDFSHCRTRIANRNRVRIGERHERSLFMQMFHFFIASIGNKRA